MQKFSIIERFIVLMCAQTSITHSVNKEEILIEMQMWKQYKMPCSSIQSGLSTKREYVQDPYKLIKICLLPEVLVGNTTMQLRENGSHSGSSCNQYQENLESTLLYAIANTPVPRY